MCEQYDMRVQWHVMEPSVVLVVSAATAAVFADVDASLTPPVRSPRVPIPVTVDGASNPLHMVP